MGAPLRVGVVVPREPRGAGRRAPRWMRTVLERIKESSFARLDAVIQGDPPAASPGGALYRAYSFLDDVIYRRRATLDVLAETDLDPVLQGLPVTGAADAPELDVILDLTGAGTTARARHGVWSYDHAGELSGFWEVLEGSPTTPSALRLRDGAAGGPGRVIYRSLAPTDHVSVARNRQNNMAKSVEFVLRKLLELSRDGTAALGPVGDGDDRGPDPAPGRPGSVRLARGLARLGARWARERWIELRRGEQWILAFHLGDDRFQSLVPPPDRFWADPFPVEIEDGWLVFFEEFEHRRRRGHISMLRVGRDGSHGPAESVLETDSHLSYPCVFSWRGDWYMVPETSARRTVELYRATRFPERWEPCATLMTGVRAADTTLAEIDGRWWLFTCMAAEGALAADELYVFHAPTPLGPFTPHRRNPVKSDVRSARPAGGLFHENGVWHRPAQDCAGRYGRAIVICRLDRLTPDDYEETETRRLEPDWNRRIVATHTFNRAGDLTIVDALRLR